MNGSTSGSSGFGGGWATTGLGTARWMTPVEAQSLSLYEYRPNSIILGQNSRGELACFNSEGHILLLAPPRSGKGIGPIQANLAGYQGSMVITDPKGELAGVSARFRRQVRGQNVVVLDPTDKLASYGTEPPIPTHGFNPLAVLDNSNYKEVVDDIERIADALVVPQEGEKEAHWRDGARSLIKGLLTYQTFFMASSDRNLIMLARLANGVETPLEDIFLALTFNDHPDKHMRDVIARIGAFYAPINPKERASFISMMLRSLNWLNSPVWHDHLQRSDFHPYDLKAGKTTVYIICPFEKLSDYSAWFRLVLSSCIIAVMRAPKRSDLATLFIIDEYFATVGRFATLEHSIPFIEGLGGRYMMVFQYLAQLKKLWQGDEYHGIFASAGAHVFFNASDEDTSGYISRYMGKYGAMTASGNGVSYVARDLLTPDEVRTLPPNDMIAFVRGYRPAWLSKLDVRTHAAFRGCFDPNPAYFVLPQEPKASLTGAGAQGMPTLSASAALSRAKGAPTPTMTIKKIAAALEQKYPDKTLRVNVEDDMYGYDEPWFNPETGQTENVFVPILHLSLLDVL